MKDNDDISIKLEKQNMIREEIINKGYDSIQFIEYLTQCKGPGGEDINSWSVQDLKNAIKDFVYLNKNQSKNENNIINEQKNNTPLNKKENEINENKSDMPAPLVPQEKNLSETVLMNIIDITNNIFTDSSKKIEKVDYGLETPDILDCRSIDKTDLSAHQEVYVKIGFPEKIDGGFFGRDSVIFTITAIPLGFVVKRDYFDFEWLQDILIKLYNSNFIPSLPQMFTYQNKNNQDYFFNECIRNLERFINYLISDPIIKNSQILFDFLCIENQNEFKKKQKEYENTTPCNDIQNFQSINGKIDINITEQAEIKYRAIRNYCNESEKLFGQLNYNLNSIAEEFNSINKKLNESSLIWEKLINLNKENNFQKEIYSQMKTIFNTIQKLMKKENDFININIKENFYFFNKNLNNFSQLLKKVDESKRIYNKEEKDLISLKNDLYNRKQGGSEINKEVNLSKLLPKNTEATIEMKKNYGYYLNRTITEFDRMKLLDYNLFKTKILKCFKEQNNIVQEFQNEINSILSKIEEIEKIKNNKNEKEEKIEKDDKNKNINNINFN